MKWWLRFSYINYALPCHCTEDVSLSITGEEAYRYKHVVYVYSKTFYFFLLRANWVILNGATYKSPCILVVGSDEYPVFGKLCSIYVVRSKVKSKF